MKNKIILLSLVLVAVVLISGCAQKDVQPTKTPSATQTPSSATATPTPSPTQVSAAGDVLGTELAKLDSGESDLSDSDLDNLDSDLGDVERGL